jgi:hypothetical protein
VKTGTVRKGGRRTAIAGWRVKAGNKEVMFAASKFAAMEFVRENPKIGGKKCRLIPPNV